MTGKIALPAAGLLFLLSMPPVPAGAETGDRAIVAKSGETVDVREVYGASKCKSILLAPPEVEVLQGPPELKLSIREGEVKPRNCQDTVKGGWVVATAGEVKQPIEGKVTFRVKYKTKEGPRQIGYVYKVSLLP